MEKIQDKITIHLINPHSSENREITMQVSPDETINNIERTLFFEHGYTYDAMFWSYPDKRGCIFMKYGNLESLGIKDKDKIHCWSDPAISSIGIYLPDNRKVRVKISTCPDFFNCEMCLENNTLAFIKSSCAYAIGVDTKDCLFQIDDTVFMECEEDANMLELKKIYKFNQFRLIY